MKKTPKCKGCGAEGRYQINCYTCQSKRITKKPYTKTIPKHQAEDRATKLLFKKLNPPPWQCYLNISTDCIPLLDETTLQIEHVIPKSRGIEYRHDQSNLKPSCSFCNTLKGSRTLESLVIDYPHLSKLLGTQHEI